MLLLFRNLQPAFSRAMTLAPQWRAISRAIHFSPTTSYQSTRSPVQT